MGLNLTEEDVRNIIAFSESTYLFTHNVTCYNTGKWLLTLCAVLETSASTETNRQHSGTKRHGTHRNERDSCKNHGDNFNWFRRKTFEKNTLEKYCLVEKQVLRNASNLQV